MVDQETKEVLCSVLEMLKQQVILSDRILGWTLAVGDTIRQTPALDAELVKHPFYIQATAPPLRTTGVMIRNIEELVQKLKG